MPQMLCFIDWTRDFATSTQSRLWCSSSMQALQCMNIAFRDKEGFRAMAADFQDLRTKMVVIR
jgi:hypothetical protein